MSEHWQRAIVFVDMNAFFASIEQYDHPQLRDRPVGITNGKTGTCLITNSYEARAYGISTGMRLKHALRLCPHLIRIPARPERYAEVSINIMRSLKAITPDVEVFSVDEAFLDVTRCQRLMGSPESIAKKVRELIHTVSGLHCSIGLSGDKTTAKWAAKKNKPNGFTIVHPDQAGATLARVPVTDLCGISVGIGGFLKDRKVDYCGQMARLPISALGQRFGNPGRRIWLMAQGLDPESVNVHVAPPKSVGHGKVMPPNTQDMEIIKMYLQHMCQKVGARLRRYNLEASRFFFGLRIHGYQEGWLKQKTDHLPIQNSAIIYRLALCFFQQHWHGQGVSQVQVTALNLKSQRQQSDLFIIDNDKESSLNRAMDNINNRFGEFAVAPATLINRSEMPNVIAPAWKPFGHRETILHSKALENT